jgi:hypothetical protein
MSASDIILVAPTEMSDVEVRLQLPDISRGFFHKTFDRADRDRLDTNASHDVHSASRTTRGGVWRKLGCLWLIVFGTKGYVCSMQVYRHGIHPSTKGRAPEEFLWTTLGRGRMQLGGESVIYSAMESTDENPVLKRHWRCEILRKHVWWSASDVGNRLIMVQ